MKKIKQIKEEIVNTVGSGQIAGLEPDIPPVPKGVTTKGSMLRRKYAKENRDAPIIIEDELTGAMVYLKYGKR
jgi:hypothetical protein